MKAWELLNEPGKWTQGYFAKDAAGVLQDDVKDPSVVSWCMLGAVAYCYGWDAHYCEARDRLTDRIRPPRTLTQWNDDPVRTYEEVVGVLKELDL